ncbi:MAG: metallophosphoesterase [Thermoguttaceae bacterium]|nr:metallophosphoesterase [Thermoguttaceae bacterium]
MDKQFDRRTFLGASALVLCLPSKLVASEPSNEMVLRFAACSDVHYDRTHNDQSAEHVRFNAALKTMNEYSASQPYNKFDALVVAGDFSNHGVVEEIGAFKKTMDDNLASATRRVLCMGNHEFYGGNRELWEKTFETPANRRQEINGYQFITVAPEKGTCNENDYLYAREWLENEIKAAIAADPTKPVFLVQHYHVYHTVFGSYDLPGDFHAGVKDFADILEKYPQIVHISGHSHYPSVEPRSVWQGKFTAIGTGSLSYFGLELYETRRQMQIPNNADFRLCGTFLIFEIYKDNTIRVRLYDTISGSFLDQEYLIVDPLNVDKYVYTDRRYDFAKVPVWGAAPKVETVELAPNGIAVKFTQANDNDCLLYYRVVAEEERDGNWIEKKTSYVWSDFFMKERQETLELDVVGLTPGMKHRVKIYGVGAFQKETEEPLVHEFRTPDDGGVDKKAAKPEADFLDVSFEADQKSLVVKPDPAVPQSFVKRFKEPKIEVDENGNAYALFNGVDESLQFPFERLRGKIAEISLGVKFQLDLSKKKDKTTISIFGSTESGGIGLEYIPDKKALFARLWLNHKYQDLSVPFDSNELATVYLTWNQDEFAFYLDGKKVASSKLNGAFRFTRDKLAQAFCLGGDVCPNFATRWFFPGKIYGARVYSWGLTSEQVQNLS